MKHLAHFLTAVFVLTACGGAEQRQQDSWDEDDEGEIFVVEAHLAERLNDIRQAWRRDPGNPRTAMRFGVSVEMGLGTGRIPMATEEALALIKEARGYLKKARDQHVDARATLFALEAQLLLADGRRKDAVNYLEQSLAAKPNGLALTELLRLRGGRKAEEAKDCKGALAGAGDDQALRFEVLHTCLEHRHPRTVEDGLPWASEEDRAFYIDESVRQAEAGGEQVSGPVQASLEAREVGVSGAQSAPSANESKQANEEASEDGLNRSGATTVQPPTDSP